MFLCSPTVRYAVSAVPRRPIVLMQRGAAGFWLSAKSNTEVSWTVGRRACPWKYTGVAAAVITGTTHNPTRGPLMGMYDASRPLKRGLRPTQPSRRMVRELRALWKVARRGLVGRPTLLDYGSGAGRWSRAAVHVGFAVCSYEPSRERAPSNGMGETEFRVVTTLDALRGQRFDAVNLEQVLEHTQDPVGTLQSLRELAHEGTVIRITVPDAERVIYASDVWKGFPFDGETVHIMSPYEHLQGFSPRSFARVLKESGLVRLANVALLSTHPLHAARQVVGRVVRRAQHTMAIARFAE